MLLTIVVPVYNLAEYLSPLINQLNKLPSNVEVIFIDDGSFDSSRRVIISEMADTMNFRIISIDNGGVSHARNLGLDKASGNYIWFIDGDDSFKASSVIQLLQLLEKSLNKYQLIELGFCCDDDDEKYSESCADLKTTTISKDKLLMELGVGKVDNFSWSYIVRRDILLKFGIKFPVGRNFEEDAAVTYRVFSKCDTILKITDPIYQYKIRKDSASYKIGPDKLYDGLNTLNEIFGSDEYKVKGVRLLFNRMAVQLFVFSTCEFSNEFDDIQKKTLQLLCKRCTICLASSFRVNIYIMLAKLGLALKFRKFIKRGSHGSDR